MEAFFGPGGCTYTNFRGRNHMPIHHVRMAKLEKDDLPSIAPGIPAMYYGYIIMRITTLACYTHTCTFLSALPSGVCIAQEMSSPLLVQR